MRVPSMNRLWLDQPDDRTGSEQRAIWAATVAVRRVLAQSKNRHTLLGRMSPTAVAYHAAVAAIDEWRNQQP